MNGYTIEGPWHTVRTWTYGEDVISLQAADLRSERDHRTFSDGAWRVTINGKIVKRGKKGHGPFLGETAYTLATNAFHDALADVRRAALR